MVGANLAATAALIQIKCRGCVARIFHAEPDPAKASVTRLATDYGFWELGRFSVAYQALFGESPSASLRKPSNALGATRARPLSSADSVFA
jgi:AraC-like DNA-binding protein